VPPFSFSLSVSNAFLPISLLKSASFWISTDHQVTATVIDGDHQRSLPVSRYPSVLSRPILIIARKVAVRVLSYIQGSIMTFTTFWLLSSSAGTASLILSSGNLCVMNFFTFNFPEAIRSMASRYCFRFDAFAPWT